MGSQSPVPWLHLGLKTTFLVFSEMRKFFSRSSSQVDSVGQTVLQSFSESKRFMLAPQPEKRNVSHLLRFSLNVQRIIVDLQVPTCFSWKQTSRGFGQQTENSPNGLRWHLCVDGHVEPIGPHCIVLFDESESNFSKKRSHMNGNGENKRHKKYQPTLVAS